MTPARQKWLTLVAVLGLAYWFFGNLYEAIVFSPNWVVDTPAQMTRLHGFFVNTGPTLYFVPLTFLAALLTWLLLALNRDPALRADYRRASLVAVVLMGLNAFIVATVVSKLFGAGYPADPERLSAYAWRWNVLNVLRMMLTATAAVILFNAFRKLDRRPGAD
ncbi:hypothetical protein EV385_5005 [Krasilnikovia cinnamomea]|uniref:DUF1772 domain-containing protein n=1 Tax=Krasilnikovia cinnamomea TaxID=349313 RepID=A0A4Q7ZRR7_9ACTN|nr:hypothetical protein [Krasilnikovia cinnamomea]RZU53119.1 hypothetical protein EV385_5005 [Krasilnikovia cinnamomea]